VLEFLRKVFLDRRVTTLVAYLYRVVRFASRESSLTTPVLLTRRSVCLPTAPRAVIPRDFLAGWGLLAPIVALSGPTNRL
jgi:hypothetical protein